MPHELANGEENQTGTLSILSIEGIVAGSSLKIRGTLGGYDVVVLLDSGYSHSFLYKSAAR